MEEVLQVRATPSHWWAIDGGYRKTSWTRIDSTDITSRERGFNLGDRIVRKWRGINYEITILRDGFSYRGAKYSSLSEIARLITGTRWSGPRFFRTRRKAM